MGSPLRTRARFGSHAPLPLLGRHAPQPLHPSSNLIGKCQQQTLLASDPLPVAAVREESGTATCSDNDYRIPAATAAVACCRSSTLDYFDIAHVVRRNGGEHGVDIVRNRCSIQYDDHILPATNPERRRAAGTADQLKSSDTPHKELNHASVCGVQRRIDADRRRHRCRPGGSQDNPFPCASCQCTECGEDRRRREEPLR